MGIPGGRQNKASGDFSIALGRRAEAKDDRSLVINLQEGGGTLTSNGIGTFSAAAKRYVFQIGEVQAVIDGTSIVELNAVLNPSRDQRNLRSTHLMTSTRIRELIQEQKMKYEEQQHTVSKLKQELESMVKVEKHHQERRLELEDYQEQEDSGRSLEKAELVTGAATTEEQGKTNMAVGTGSVVNGGEKNTASGSLSVVGGGLKNALVQSVLSVVDLRIKLRRLLPLVLLVVDSKIK